MKIQGTLEVVEMEGIVNQVMEGQEGKEDFQIQEMEVLEVMGESQ